MDEWDEEDLELFQEIIKEMIAEVRVTAKDIYQTMVKEAEAQRAQELLSAGGSVHSQIQQTIIDNAQRWYDAYPSPPRKYKRRGTLTNPENIAIEATINAGSVNLSIEHNSDQAAYVRSGFWIYSRTGKFFREGCNWVENVDAEHVTVDVSLSQSEVNELYDNAVDAVL